MDYTNTDFGAGSSSRFFFFYGVDKQTHKHTYTTDQPTRASTDYSVDVDIKHFNAKTIIIGQGPLTLRLICLDPWRGGTCSLGTEQNDLVGWPP